MLLSFDIDIPSLLPDEDETSHISFFICVIRISLFLEAAERSLYSLRTTGAAFVGHPSDAIKPLHEELQKWFKGIPKHRKLMGLAIKTSIEQLALDVSRMGSRKSRSSSTSTVCPPHCFILDRSLIMQVGTCFSYRTNYNTSSSGL